MSIVQDEHGQPATSRLHQASRQTRNIDELIGICRGVTLDNVVNQSKVEERWA